MTGSPVSRDKSHFERLYEAAEDPWNFRASAYERNKYETTLQALPPGNFSRGLEVGCSIGELTALLAPRCDSLLALDIAEAPLVTARARCATMPHIAFRQMEIPREWPEGQFDLIMLSEVLYFLSPADLLATAARVCGSLGPGGIVLLVNWLGAGGDPGTGDTAAEGFIAASCLRVHLRQRHAEFRIDRLAG